MKPKSSVPKIPFTSFFSEVQIELKKVTWPNRQQILRLTVMVIVVSFATGAYLGALDYGFTQLVSFLLSK